MQLARLKVYTHTHTHTHIYIYIYIVILSFFFYSSQAAKEHNLLTIIPNKNLSLRLFLAFVFLPSACNVDLHSLFEFSSPCLISEPPTHFKASFPRASPQAPDGRVLRSFL